MPEYSLSPPECWLDEHGSALYRYALSATRDSHQAEELVQDTLVTALQACARYNGQSAPRTWFIGILKNKLMDQFRRSARQVSLDEEEDDGDWAGAFNSRGFWADKPADWGNPDELLERSEFRELLSRCLALLPQRLSHLFWLREVRGEDSEFICKELEISPTNLWTMLHRGRMGLRKCLDKHWA
jgi:RNA polymerase sigma-70 factor (ECF subfamily)